MRANKGVGGMKSVLNQFNLVKYALCIGASLILTSGNGEARSYSRCYPGGFHHYRGYHGHRHHRHRGHYGHHRKRHRYSFKYYYPKTYYPRSYTRKSYPHRYSIDRYIQHDNGNDSNEIGRHYVQDIEAEKPISYKKQTSTSPWQDLANNQSRKALKKFGKLATQTPTNVMPKVGYALAAGLQGDHRRAVWAMRRAFRTNPQGIKFITKNENLSYRIMELVDEYNQSAKKSIKASGANFMLGALSYLQKDLYTAEYAATEAIENGDDTESTRNLFALVQNRKHNIQSINSNVLSRR